MAGRGGEWRDAPIGSRVWPDPMDVTPISSARSRLTRDWSMHPEGSVLVEFGDTRVLCTASVTEGVPRWRKGSGLGLGDQRVLDAAPGHQQPARTASRSRAASAGARTRSPG